MNEKMQVFEYEETPIRTVMKDGELWWVLADVCRVLGLSNSSRVAERLDDDEKQRLVFNPNSDLGLEHNGATIISESGLYSVILRSYKSEAKPFRRWVTHEVLPSIRKTGTYRKPAAPPVSPEILLQCATIMAGCLEGNRSYVLNILRPIIPDIDKAAPVSVGTDGKPVEIPQFPEQKVTEVPPSHVRESTYFNHFKLQKLMEEQRLRNVDIARQVDVDASTVKRWRSGTCPPRDSNRTRLCEVLDVPLTYFDL